MKDNFKNGITHGWSHINSDKSRRSYPEKFFYNVFMENKMYEKYTILEKHPYGKYFIDFLFVEIKLIVEIDGSQHYRNQEAILHDSIRDEYFKNEGFKIYRIKWSDVCMDPRGEISCLIEFIKDNKNRESRTYTLEECKKIPKKRKKIRNKKCTNCNSLIGRENNLCRECWKITIKKSSKKKRIPKRKNNCIHCDSPIYGKNYCRKCYNKSQFRSERPKYRDLLLEISESGYVKVSKKYGVSDNAIRKWIRSYEKE
jgi:very-short-patch-repair endonuclease